jgi:hypothetical protein
LQWENELTRNSNFVVSFRYREKFLRAGKREELLEEDLDLRNLSEEELYTYLVLIRISCFFY